MTGTLPRWLPRSGPILVLLGAFVAVLLRSRALRAPSDDAYICFVYARNWLEGAGYTYNGLRVEGCTSTLWMLLVSWAGALGIPIPYAAEFLSTGAGFFVLLCTHSLARAVGLTRWNALLPVVLVAASGDFAFYVSAGMEQGLFTALVVACSAIVLGRDPKQALGSWHLAILVSLMILTRPQGFLVAGMLYGAAFAMAGTPRPLVGAAARVGVLLGPCLALKWAYYGYPFPNTWYAKAGGGFENLGLGLQYLGTNLPRYAPLLLLLALAAGSRFWTRPRVRAHVLVLLGFVLVWITAIGVLGGDNLVGARVLLPALPWVCVGLVRMATPEPGESSAPWVRPAVVWGAATLVCVGLWLGFTRDEGVRNHAERWRQYYPIRERAGLFLKAELPPDTLVAVDASGIIPYFSGLPTLDMMGLNDPHIAHHGKRDHRLPFGHQAGDGDYVLERRPAVIVFGPALRDYPSHWLADNRDFHRLYRPVELDGLGHVWVRSDFAWPRGAEATSPATPASRH